MASFLAAGLAASPGAAFAEGGAPTGPRVALGVSAGVGQSGAASDKGYVLEVNARAQIVPWLGIGAAFFDSKSDDSESAGGPHARALELFVSVHPVTESWFDPFLRAGMFTYIDSLPVAGQSDPGHGTGVDVEVGANVALRHVAFGVHFRRGDSDRGFTLFGLQVEGRL